MGKTAAELANLRLEVVRPDDLVVMSIRFQGLRLEDAGPDLVPERDDAVIIVDLPPQSFAEEAFFESAAELGDGRPERPPAPLGQVGIRLAKPARLVFRTPPSFGRIRYDLDGILDACRRASLATGHQPSGVLFPLEPGELHTAIEAPYGIRVTPDDPAARWSHSTAPAFGLGSFALWHTRLGRQVERNGRTETDEPDRHPPGSTSPRPVLHLRAAWHGSKVDESAAEEIPTSLGRQDREDLVDYGKERNDPPVAAERLILSALGAWTEVGWEPPPGQKARKSLQAWVHRMTMGRDHYVRVVALGNLFPFGHAASTVVVSERKVRPDGTAYLRQRTQLVVLEPVRQFTDRDMPFEKVRITTLSTPKLFDPSSPPSEVDPGRAFWPMVTATDDFLFHLVANDLAGREVQFVAPLIFVREGADIAKVIDEYSNADEARRVRPMSGQRISYVRTSPAEPLGSTFDTTSIELTAVPGAGGAGQPAFRPLLKNAVAVIPAVRNLTGKEQVGFRYPDEADAQGLAGLDVFAVLTDDPSKSQMTFSPETSGGIVKPDARLTSLSHTLGPLGGTTAELRGGTFNPVSFFGEEAKLLGAVSLSEILGPVLGLTAGSAVQTARDPFSKTDVPMPVVPRLVMEQPDRAIMRWSTSELQDSGAFRKHDPAQQKPGTPQKPRTQLWLEVVRDTSSSEATSKTSGHIGPFTLSLPLIDIPVDFFRFVAETGRKLDVSVMLGTIIFKQELSFVNTLATIIPANGFEDPPALDVSDEGVTAGYSLAVPALSFGIFNLQNLLLSSQAHLPLVTGPGRQMSVNFHLSQRHDPFLVSVSSFGGLGFFGIDLGLDGVHMLEASLEFGGALALSIGVASGGVTVTAGLYYANALDKSAFAGFVRVNGALEVLGVISISAQFYLELAHADGKVWGSATVTVKVKIVFFSKSVSMTVTREFQGSPPPTFVDVMPEPAWREYCEAFAPDGA